MGQEQENCGRKEPAFSFPLGLQLRWSPLGQLAAGVEMEAMHSENSDYMTVKAPGSLDDAPVHCHECGTGSPASQWAWHDSPVPVMPVVQFCQQGHLCSNCHSLRDINQNAYKHSIPQFFSKWPLSVAVFCFDNWCWSENAFIYVFIYAFMYVFVCL